MTRLQKFLFFLPPWLSATAAAAQGRAVLIGYTNCAAVPKLSREQFDKIAQLKWHFAHASVGANMMDGIADLRQADAGSYQLRGLTAEATAPAATQPGVIYEHPRGNPGWKAKFDQFHDAVSNGWHFPLVNVVMNKLCYIDQGASFTYYINSMTNLEAAWPQTTFVFMTMPLMTAEDGDNYLRNAFNNRVRDWCRVNGRVLFDIAEMEAHDAKGVPCTFTYRGRTCQKLCPGFTTDGGHLNNEGRQFVARGFYALGAAVADKPAQNGAAQPKP
jgi:hypothetical protein